MGITADMARSADERISELKAEIGRLQHDINNYVAINVEYLAEIERMRAALKDISEDCYIDGGQTEPAKIASAALMSSK